ncbi:hypothetical protein BDZ97DRAFT_1758810 [Flammula alnicola]|nr:hypothetical protein BDZ97DRAFT_1758810 [Flammula alnicola]
MSSAICAYLQPIWDILRRKLLMFVLTPDTRRISAASMALSGLTNQMGNYMRGLEVTRSPEPVACVRVRRWLCFLAHVAGETPPPFAFFADFDPSSVADFYPLHPEEISEADMDSEPPFPELVGLAQRLLDATWVRSPVVGPLVAYSPSPSPVLVYCIAAIPTMDLDEPRLSLPPATPAAIPEVRLGETQPSPTPILDVVGRPEERLRCFVEVPPRPSKSRKGKGKACARTPPPSLPRPLVTRAAAAKLAAVSRQEARPGVASGSRVTLDTDQTPPRPLKRKVAALGDARSKRPRPEVTPEAPELVSSPPSKLAAAQLALLLGAVPKPLAPPVCIACSLKGLKPEDCIVPQGEQGCIPCQRSRRGICSFRAKLKDQMPDFESFLEFGQSSLTNLQNLFERIQRISATNVLQRALVRQSDLEISVLSREVLGILYRLVASDPDNSFRELYLADDDAMETLIDVLSALSPGDLSSNDRYPTHSTSLSELSLLLQGVATPPWLLHPSHILPPRPRVVPYQESEPDADEASAFLDTDSERATLDALDRDVGDLDDFECYQ